MTRIPSPSPCNRTVFSSVSRASWRRQRQRTLLEACEAKGARESVSGKATCSARLLRAPPAHSTRPTCRHRHCGSCNATTVLPPWDKACGRPTARRAAFCSNFLIFKKFLYIWIFDVLFLFFNCYCVILDKIRTVRSQRIFIFFPLLPLFNTL